MHREVGSAVVSSSESEYAHCRVWGSVSCSLGIWLCISRRILYSEVEPICFCRDVGVASV